MGPVGAQRAMLRRQRRGGGGTAADPRPAAALGSGWPGETARSRRGCGPDRGGNGDGDGTAAEPWPAAASRPGWPSLSKGDGAQRTSGRSRSRNRCGAPSGSTTGAGLTTGDGAQRASGQPSRRRRRRAPLRNPCRQQPQRRAGWGVWCAAGQWDGRQEPAARGLHMGMARTRWVVSASDTSAAASACVLRIVRVCRSCNDQITGR